MANDKIIKVINSAKPKIVVIGGGTGLSVILKGLHELDADVAAIVTVADDGGSSGTIRDYINVVPPGDIRNVMAALSDLPRIYLDIFQYRFESNDSFFAGHSIGNLIIAALAEMDKGIFEAVQTLSRLMKVRGHVYPVADEPLTLHATFTDDTKVSGEHDITAAGKTIKEISITRKDGTMPEPVPEAVQVILDADVIVLGPGSVFTSILPNLIIPKIKDALVKTKAEVIYICNIMTQFGETEDLSDYDHLKIMENHLGSDVVDTILVNNVKIPHHYLDREKYPEYSKQVAHDFTKLKDDGVKIISDNYLRLQDGGIFHDEKRITEEVINIANQNARLKNRR